MVQSLKPCPPVTGVSNLILVGELDPTGHKKMAEPVCHSEDLAQPNKTGISLEKSVLEVMYPVSTLSDSVLEMLNHLLSSETFSQSSSVCVFGETVSDFMFGGSKITADDDCSHEIKRRLLLGRKVMTNLDSIFKSRDITLLTKVRLVKAMVFPMVMYGCESWTMKKAECQKIDAFELWCWRRLLRVPWTARRSNQSILKEISSGCSLEGMMLKLKLQYLATSCKELTHWKRL